MAIKTFTAGSVLTASDTNTYLANSGLVYVRTGTFTNTTSFNVDNVFTSTFTHYKIYIAMRPQTTQTGGAELQLRAGGSNLALGSYTWQGYNQNAANNPTPNNTTGSTGGWYLSNLYTATDYSSISEITMFAPQKTAFTGYLLNTFFDWASNTYYARTANGYYQQTTSADGFRIIPSVASSGFYSVYGMREA